MVTRCGDPGPSWSFDRSPLCRIDRRPRCFWPSGRRHNIGVRARTMVPFPCSLARHNLCGRWRRSGSTQYRCPWPVRVIRAQVCRSAGVGTSSSFDDAVRGTLGNKRPYFLCRRRFASIDWGCCQQITPPLDARSMLLKAPLPSIGRINICSAGVPFGRNQLQAQTRAGPIDAPNTSILDFFSNSRGRLATRASFLVQLPKCNCQSVARPTRSRKKQERVFT